MPDLLALDISSTAVGWTYMEERKRKDGGTVWRKKDEGMYDFAWRVLDEVQEETPEWARTVYEVNYSPMPRQKQKSLAICNQAIGRVLQTLGVEGESYQADNKKKPERRAQMALIYKLKKMSEHEADSLALAHRVVSEVTPTSSS